jgi:hypothetical protein
MSLFCYVTDILGGPVGVDISDVSITAIQVTSAQQAIIALRN